MGSQSNGQRQILLDAAYAAQPTLAGHAEWAETHGRLHEDSIQALVDARVPRMFLPADLGGDEVDPVTCALVCETLADADPAAAWHVMVYNAARLMAATWPQATVERVWADQPDAMVAASGHSALTGVRTAQGVVVSGKNSFVSGCHHAHFVMSPLLLDDEPHMVLVPADAVEIVDNWDTLGMRGTGSNDVLIEGVEVALELVVPQRPDLVRSRGRNVYASGTLYQCPSRIVFATYVPVALSLAGRALTELVNLAQNKVPYATDQKLRERSQAQMHYGRALAKFKSVRLYFHETLDAVWQRAQRGHKPTTEERAELYLAGTHTLQTCTEVVRHVLDAAGSNVFHKSQPLERIMRDMETLKHHGFANESRYASVAQALWGATLDYPLLLR
ncbi:MAG: acyl-CoA dehydrogenase family protein [Pseudomonadota bacterium]